MTVAIDDWSAMTEEDKYVEWSTYVTSGAGSIQATLLVDYSDYCDWMDNWAANNV